MHDLRTIALLGSLLAVSIGVPAIATEKGQDAPVIHLDDDDDDDDDESIFISHGLRRLIRDAEKRFAELRSNGECYDLTADKRSDGSVLISFLVSLRQYPVHVDGGKMYVLMDDRPYCGRGMTFEYDSSGAFVRYTYHR
ncbi:hypothetical protein [Acuticoccus kandeliae]|uniref:hypothetical protein n=1 Tax=Acuticoccus kandeliae TaxID=2073160 RepID=UPI000D3E6261|nr:hypothetical protein [Acuticoccus kandeliae]